MQVGDELVPLDDVHRATALAGVEALSAEAFRTLAVAYRRLDGGRGSKFDDATNTTSFISASWGSSTRRAKRSPIP